MSPKIPCHERNKKKKKKKKLLSSLLRPLIFMWFQRGKVRDGRDNVFRNLLRYQVINLKV